LYIRYITRQAEVFTSYFRNKRGIRYAFILIKKSTRIYGKPALIRGTQARLFLKNKLKIKLKKIKIYNIYNLLPGLYFTRRAGSLKQVKNIIKINDTQILLKNFNLYYFI